MKNVRTLISKIDVKTHELRVVIDKHPETWQCIDTNAINCFYELIGEGKLKCSIGHNRYGKQHYAINKGTVSKRCTR